MDQRVIHQALHLPIIHGPKVGSAPESEMAAQPGARTLRVARAAVALAQAGQRLALIARRVGQPADTFTGPEAPAPEDVRVRYVSGVFGGIETPLSPRNASRRW